MFENLCNTQFLQNIWNSSYLVDTRHDEKQLIIGSHITWFKKKKRTGRMIDYIFFNLSKKKEQF